MYQQQTVRKSINKLQTLSDQSHYQQNLEFKFMLLINYSFLLATLATSNAARLVYLNLKAWIWVKQH